MYDAKKTGERIKELRKQRGMTQEALAKAFKTESCVICKIEKGYQPISLDYAVDIAEYFGVSLDYLINGENVVDDEISMVFNQIPLTRKADMKKVILEMLRIYIDY